MSLSTLIRVRALLLLATVALAACPHLPPVSGCQPTAQSCDGNRPRVCSASQRWEPVGDLPCSGACVVTANIAHCAAVAP